MTGEYSATHCNTLQHNATTHCNTLQHYLVSYLLINIYLHLCLSTTHCNHFYLQHNATHLHHYLVSNQLLNIYLHVYLSATNCNYTYPQHTATQCTPLTTPSRTRMYIYLQQTATILICNTLRHNAPHLRHHLVPHQLLKL